MANPQGINQYNHEETAHNKEMFLIKFRELWTMSAACKSLNISRSTVNEWRKNDLEFKGKYEEVMEELADDYRAEVRRRAFEGNSKMADTLLMFSTKAYCPEFRDNIRASDHDSMPLQINIVCVTRTQLPCTDNPQIENYGDGEEQG